MPRIENIINVRQFLTKLSRVKKQARVDNKVSVIVGYEKNYAAAVHENTEMKWKGKPRTGKHPSGQKKKGKYWDPEGQGQSKFLEQPARENRKQLGDIIIKAGKNGVPLSTSLVLAGLNLQRASQKLVPVDSGDLKASAFTKKERN